MSSYKYPTPSEPFQEGFTYDDYDPNDVPDDQRADILPGRKTNTSIVVKTLCRIWWLASSKYNTKAKAKTRQIDNTGATKTTSDWIET